MLSPSVDVRISESASELSRAATARMHVAFSMTCVAKASRWQHHSTFGLLPVTAQNALRHSMLSVGRPHIGVERAQHTIPAVTFIKRTEIYLHVAWVCSLCRLIITIDMTCV